MATLLECGGSGDGGEPTQKACALRARRRSSVVDTSAEVRETDDR
jgi:hypothetical protein